VGDDFSTDDTLLKIRDYTFINPNLELNILEREISDTYYRDRKKKGRLFNFADILNNCKGNYVAFLDGDDYWTDPLKLQKQVDFLEENDEYFICFHPCSIEKLNVEGFDKIKQPFDSIDYEYSIYNLLANWGIGTASIVIRNKLVIPDWFTEVASGDIALVMSHFKKGKFKMRNDYMSVYRITGKGVSESHTSYRMVHYRSKLYGFLNEHFNYKYEKEIYRALLNIYAKYDLIPIEHFLNKKIRKIK